MANYHVLEINTAGDRARVAFHIATPSGNNNAVPTPVAYATALVQYLTLLNGAAPATVVPWGPSDAADVAAGTIYEHVESVQFNAHATNVDKLAFLDARWTALSSVIPSRLAIQLAFWGMDRDVP